MRRVQAELPGAWRSIARTLVLGHRAQPRLLVAGFVAALAAAAPEALFALAFAALVNGLRAADRRTVTAATTALAVLATATWLMKVSSERLNLQLTERAAVDLEAHVVALQTAVPTLELHERKAYLDRLALLRDHASTLSELYQMLFSVAGAVVRLAITLAMLISVHVGLGLLGVLALPAVLISTWRAGVEKRAEEAGAEHQRRARSMVLLGTTPAAAKEVRVAQVQDRLQQELTAALESHYRPVARARWGSAAWLAIAYVVFGLGFVLAVMLVVRAGASAGSVLLVLAAGGRLSQYLGQTVQQTHFFRTIWLEGARRLVWLEDLAREGQGGGALRAPDRLTQGIRFDRVSFRYPDTDRDVLSKVSFTLPAGSVIAIVGLNGAGKSSIVKLLAKFYEPTEGRIDVDETDLRRISSVSWRNRLSGAFQDFFSFEYPARIAIGVGELARADDGAAVTRAACRGGAAGIVEALPRGIDTQLGQSWENGVDLSHGQWQRVALARGFMREAPLLVVLDEPTSALDADAEHELFERYAAAARQSSGDALGRITVLVSHRFSTVQMSDLIFVVDDGRVVEYGSHQDLMARTGVYAELYRIQAAGYRRDDLDSGPALSVAFGAAEGEDHG